MKDYTDSFVLSQYKYYQKHLLSGNHADRLLIRGTYHMYQAEARRRGLIK